MIRPAKFTDIPAMVALLEHAHEKSVYREVCDVDRREARAYLMSAIQRHGSPNEGGAYVAVTESFGTVHGMMIGVLDRIYVVGSKLRAIDAHYYGTEQAGKRDMLALFDGFVEWAEGIDKVALIQPTATHVLGDYSAAEALYQKRGFVKAGVLYERRVER